jgi:ligand-binding sensor protein
MPGELNARIPVQRLGEVLQNLQAFTGIAVQLIDSEGTLVMTYGQPNGYCGCLKKNVFVSGECASLHLKAGQRAQKLGQAYIFSCHADLNHIAFPLTDREELLGTVIIGPFMMDEADSTHISGLAEKYQLSPALSLELYDALTAVPVMAPVPADAGAGRAYPYLPVPGRRGGGDPGCLEPRGQPLYRRSRFAVRGNDDLVRRTFEENEAPPVNIYEVNTMQTRKLFYEDGSLSRPP